MNTNTALIARYFVCLAGGLISVGHAYFDGSGNHLGLIFLCTFFACATFWLLADLLNAAIGN